MEQYERVRIRKLLHPAEHYNGWGFNSRVPEVGDMGCVVDILSVPGLPDNYVVEASGPDGMTIWLGDFSREEIEPISEQPEI